MTLRELADNYQYIKDLTILVYDECIAYNLDVTDSIYENDSIIATAIVGNYELCENYLYVNLLSKEEGDYND